MAAIREWTESLWGRNSPYVKKLAIEESIGEVPLDRRVKIRMPTAPEKRELHARDGYHCRFCGIPVVRKEIRVRIRRRYPEALSWGRTNPTQHAAFQAMWAQYDHVVPHARGGTNALENLVVTCAPCNFGRMSYSLAQVGLLDPRTREPARSVWEGLERFK
jgi:5-methylcytosine-specific restriction endonuclease McrA